MRRDDSPAERSRPKIKGGSRLCQENTGFLRVLTCFCLILGTAMAQVKSSAITGIVTDASGAFVPNATIVVTNEQTNIAVQAKSNGAGEYTVPYLEAGRYSVAVSATGL